MLAIEGDMQQFIYSYRRVIDQGFDAQRADVWTVPEVEVALPAERINRVLHTTLDSSVLQLVADVRPLLMEECQITDVAAAR